MTTSGASQASTDQSPESHDTPEQQSPLSVVGIGASAGGLKALQAFFDAVPTDTDLTFVVIVHLSPEHESQLPELLQAHTEMPVTQVTDRVEMELNHVYVIPPAHRLIMTDTHLSLQDFTEPRGQRMPVDDFFRSLADTHGDGAAIVLSGSGSDGAVGIRGIKEGGGLLMVQDPDEAEYDGMPRSAIHTGLVDVVAPVRELAATLVRYKRNAVSLEVPAEPAALPKDEQDMLVQILSHVQRQTGHDFSRYKRSTILRRLRRRMQLHQTKDLLAYLELLRRDDEDVEALYRDLLISVTRFFRDQDAYDILTEEVIPQLFAGKEHDEAIRIWVAGCATGEEAYSLAILLAEQAARLDHPRAYKIFATDLDPHALNVARQGFYPEAIATDVSEERLARFFKRDNAHYRVRQELRERMVFARHNLLQDPPFAHLDLLSCRNLLIYLQRGLQEDLHEVFAYALRPGGILFLGSAESLPETTGLFETMDKSLSMYRRTQGNAAMPLLPTISFSSVPEMRLQIDESTTPPSTREPAEVHRQMIEDYAPPSLVVDANYTVVHLSNTAGRFLQLHGGTVTNDLSRLVRPELQTELFAGLQRAFDDGEATVARPVRVQFNGKSRVVYLTVRPRERTGRDTEERLVLVLFNEDERSAETGVDEGVERTDEATAAKIRHLEEELRNARRRLERMQQDFSTSEQELHAANEELQSINEEYKSTLEELEASKEELQSMNEELQSTNQELENKVAELRQAHSDLENLFAATNIATLFLDRELRIRRYTPPMEELFTLRPDDEGRPISDLRANIEYDHLEDDARAVLKNLTPVEREVGTDDAWYLVRVRPYRTLEDKIDGVAFTFVDITDRKEMEEALRAAKEYAESIVGTVPEPLIVLDGNLRVQSANDAFYNTFQVRPEETEGRRIYDLGNEQWDIPELRTLLEDVLPENHSFENFEVDHNFESIGRRIMLLNGHRLDDIHLILLAIQDITERKQAEHELRELNAELQARTNKLRELAVRLTRAEQEERHRIGQLLHDDLQQLLYSVQLSLDTVQDAVEEWSDDEALLQKLVKADERMRKAIQTTRRLTVDLSPPILEGEGLTEALGWLTSQMHEQHNLTVEVDAEGSFQVLDSDLRLLLFRCVRELLFNVVKHAEVSQATVILRWVDDDLRIQVSDKGVGFDVEQVIHETPDGRGLASMRERLELVGGRMDVSSEPSKGTWVTLYAPIARSNATEDQEEEANN